MDRCNDLFCTKKGTTEACAVCAAFAERDRFIQFWFKGGLFMDSVRALKSRGVFAFLRRYALLLSFLFFVGLMLGSTWFIPQSPEWHSAVSSFLDKHSLFMIALIIGLAIPLLWFLLWKLPQGQVADVWNVKDRVDLESKSRQTLAQILGGAVLLIGLYFTAQTLRMTQEGQITERFTKAIDQLGKPGKENLAVRLGGIYALERIARDSAKDHWQIMEVLTTFVREQTQGRLDTSRSWFPLLFPKDREITETPADIQAILIVLGRRDRRGEQYGLNLRRAQLPRAILWNAHLERANLRDAHLQGADLSDAHLQGAVFFKTECQEASFSNARSVQQLRELLPKRQEMAAHLQGAYLWNTHLEGAHLEGAHLEGAESWEAHLENAHLQGAHLQDAFLWKAYLEGADLEEAELEGTHLEGVDLRMVKNLTHHQVKMACIDKDTKLPKELENLEKPLLCPAQ